MKEFLVNLKKSWKYVKDEKAKFIPFIILNILIIVITVVIPILSAKSIVALTNSKLEELLYMVIAITLIELTRNIINYLRDKITSLIFRDSFTRIQVAIGKEMLRINNKCLDEQGSGVFIQRISGDTYTIANIFTEIFTDITEFMRSVGIFTAIFIINKWMFFYIIGMQIILIYVEHMRVKKRTENDKKLREEREKSSSFTTELIRGARDVRMLNAEKNFLNAFKQKIVSLNNSSYVMGQDSRRFFLIRGTILDVSDLIKYILMIIFIKAGSLSIANALVIQNYSNSIGYFVFMIGSIYERIKEYNLSCERIFEIIDDNTCFEKEKFGTNHLDKVNGNFEFKDVTFKYDKKNVLKNLNFKVNANETVAFVGKSGSGKTTIFNLLCKMYDTYNGLITIDGVDIKTLDKDSIRGNITIISQDPYIFNLSIKDNLKLVKEDLTEKEMINACKMACLDDYIKTLPEGYDTVVGEGGVTLSGGQKQRLAIARAFVQKTEIILFDEATSALDNETQNKISEAINNLQKDYTILIIAHRLSTIKNADRILFIDDGKVIAEGNHQKLMKTCKEYKELYEKEINK